MNYAFTNSKVWLVFVFSTILFQVTYGQRDTIKFFDFEDIEVKYDINKMTKATFNNGGIFKDIEPYLATGRTVVRPDGPLRYETIDYGRYEVGDGFLYHSPTWYLQEGYNGTSCNHIELELDTPIGSGKFYKFSFLIGNFKSHRFKPGHYGVKFSSSKIIKSRPGSLLSDPDIFFPFNKDQELHLIQGIFYSDSIIKYIYFGCFIEDSARVSKVYTKLDHRISYSDTAQHVLITKPTRVAIDNILIEEMHKINTLFRDLYFDTGKDELINPEDIKVISELAVYLNKNLQHYVLIQGYTDKSGSFAFNNELSERRAEKIKEYLIANGIKEDKIISHGRGVFNTASTQKDNKYDRKVSFAVFK